VASFLGDPSGDLTSEAAALTRPSTPYAGFNLLLLEPVPSTSASASTLAYDAHLVTNGGGGGPIRSRTLTDAERACGGVSNGVDGQGGDLWPKVAQGRAELGKVLDEELSRGPAAAETDERLAGRLIELLTCVSASGPVPRVCAVGGIVCPSITLLDPIFFLNRSLISGLCLVACHTDADSFPNHLFFFE
jgi:hypothetical protein